MTVLHAWPTFMCSSYYCTTPIIIRSEHHTYQVPGTYRTEFGKDEQTFSILSIHHSPTTVVLAHTQTGILDEYISMNRNDGFLFHGEIKSCHTNA